MSALPSVRRVVTPAPLMLRRGSEADITHDGSLDGDLSLGASLPSPPPTTDTRRSFSRLQQLDAVAASVDPPCSAGLLRPPIQLRRSSSWSSKVESRSATTSPTSTRTRRATLTRRQPLPTALLSADLLAKLNAWIECIAIVNFDIDAGPELDNCYPPVSYTPQERHVIAFSSFPDHNEKGDSNSIFSWRAPLTFASQHSPQSSGSSLHGYCFFSQQRDSNNRRGYSQRSLVLLTRLSDYPGLFAELVNILAPMYFQPAILDKPNTNYDAHSDVTPAAVEAGVRNICRWPSPELGQVLELAFLGRVIIVELPLHGQPQYTSSSAILSSSTSRSRPKDALSLTGQRGISPKSSIPALNKAASLPAHLLATLPPIPLSRLLGPTLIDQIWLIWELTVLGEPMLIFADTPVYTSALVRWLVTAIRPIIYSGDYRPYFHIHMPDFGTIMSQRKAASACILGATNPLILSGGKHFTNIIQSHTERGVTETTLRTSRRRSVKKDRSALSSAMEGFKSNDFAEIDAILLRSLASMTERFLVPLNRYFATLQTMQNGIPRSRSFSRDDFLASLKTHGTPLEFRRGKIPYMSTYDAAVNSTALLFYQQFLASSNFDGWLHKRSEATDTAQRDRNRSRIQSAEAALQSTIPPAFSMSALSNKIVEVAHTGYAGPPSQSRNAPSDTKLRMVDRLKALQQRAHDSSEDSDASSLHDGASEARRGSIY